jgi:hypothetical protein
LIKYPEELITSTEKNITTTNMFWNSVIVTPGAQYIYLSVRNLYLETPLERYEHRKMPLSLFPSLTHKEYNMDANALIGFIYSEICNTIYAIPNTNRLANE